MEKEKSRGDPGAEFNERANEDSYFALKEHELLEEMKTDFQKAEAAKREALGLTCPKCSVRLGRYEFMGFVLDQCGSCEGIWLNRGELAGIVRRAAGGPLGAFLVRCFSRQ